MSPRLLQQAVALSVFIAAGSWGTVRAGLTGLAATRYFELRASRYPESASWPRPRLPGRAPLLAASTLCWPAAAAFVLVRAFGIEPSGPWIALLAAWPAIAVVLLVLGSRSPWARVRRIFGAAASVSFEKRDGVLEKAFDADPQLNGTLQS